MQLSDIKRSSFDSIRSDIEKLATDTILIIADHAVWSIYSKKLNLDTLKNKKVILWKAPDGEKAKNLREYEICVEFFLEKGIHRNAHLVAIGGGAISDFAGFVAATLLRGIKWSIVSTSLLSMVDASIGGKVGINSNSGKNLIGAFYLPQNIWINEDFLSSLPKTELESGKGEIIKYAFLDKNIYESIINSKDINGVIELCYKYKVNIVSKDLKEGNQRKLLNLGHTLGHAIEKIYPLSHGVSVYWGLALIFKLFHDGKYLNELARLKDALGIGRLESPWHNREFPVFKMMEYIRKDKKMASNQNIDLILISDIGSAYIKSYKLDEIEKKLEESKHELREFNL